MAAREPQPFLHQGAAVRADKRMKKLPTDFIQKEASRFTERTVGEDQRLSSGLF
jgi:hypothetical protein